MHGLRLFFAAMTKTTANIRFKAKLLRPAEPPKKGSWSFPILPKDASAKLPTRGMNFSPTWRDMMVRLGAMPDKLDRCDGPLGIEDAGLRVAEGRLAGADLQGHTLNL